MSAEELGAAPSRRPGWGGRVDWWLVAGLVVVTAFLAPARNAALRGDDSWSSELRGGLGVTHDNVVHAAWSSAQRFVEHGRPSVLGAAQGNSTAVALGGHPVLYRLILIALTVGCAALLYVLVRRLGLGRRAGFLVLVLLAGAIQLRSFHDAMLGYWGTTQLLVLFLLGSLIVFHSALKENDRRRFWGSVALFLPCLLLYEGAYPLAGLFLVVALADRRGRAAWRASAPFLIAAVAFVLVSVGLRAVSGEVSPGYEVGSSPWAAVRTFFSQLAVPLPASDIIFRADTSGFARAGGSPTPAELFAGVWRGLVVFGAILLVALRLAREDVARLPSARTLSLVAAVGATIWATSVLVISTAPKYQVELVPGRGHLTALVQVLGWALVGAAALLALLRAAQSRSPAAVTVTAVGCAALLGLGAGVTGAHNLRIVATEQPVVKSRALLEEAVEQGVLRAVPERGTVIFAGRDLAWPTGRWAQSPRAVESMILDRSGQRLDGRISPPDVRFGCPASGRFPPRACELPAPGSAWVRVRLERDGGSVVAASFAGGGSRPQAALARRVTVFARRDARPVAPPALVGRTGRGAAWVSSGLHWTVVKRRRHEAVFQASLPAGVAVVASSIDVMGSIYDFGAQPAPAERVRLYGVKHLLP